jgi:hypothetical protein
MHTLHLKELINRYHLTLTKWITRKPQRGASVVEVFDVSLTPERSPTPLWPNGLVLIIICTVCRGTQYAPYAP